MGDRRAKILHDGRWQEHPYDDIREGDIVSLVESSGVPVDDGRVYLVTRGYCADDPLMTIQVTPAGRPKSRTETKPARCPGAEPPTKGTQ